MIKMVGSSHILELSSDVSFESLMVIILEVFNNNCSETGSDSLLCVLTCSAVYLGRLPEEGRISWAEWQNFRFM